MSQPFGQLPPLPGTSGVGLRLPSLSDSDDISWNPTALSTIGSTPITETINTSVGGVSQRSSVNHAPRSPSDSTIIRPRTGSATSILRTGSATERTRVGSDSSKIRSSNRAVSPNPRPYPTSSPRRLDQKRERSQTYDQNRERSQTFGGFTGVVGHQVPTPAALESTMLLDAITSMGSVGAAMPVPAAGLNEQMPQFHPSGSFGAAGFSRLHPDMAIVNRGRLETAPARFKHFSPNPPSITSNAVAKSKPVEVFELPTSMQNLEDLFQVCSVEDPSIPLNHRKLPPSFFDPKRQQSGAFAQQPVMNDVQPFAVRGAQVNIADAISDGLRRTSIDLQAFGDSIGHIFTPPENLQSSASPSNHPVIASSSGVDLMEILGTTVLQEQPRHSQPSHTHDNQDDSILDDLDLDF